MTFSLVRYLVGLGADVEVTGGHLLATPLLWSVRGGHLKSVVEIIKLGGNMYARDKNEGDAFIAAAGEDHPDILAYLLAKDAQNRKSKRIGDGDKDHVEESVLKRRDNQGFSAIMWAIRCKTVDPLRALVFYGGAVDNPGALLHLALQYSPLTFLVCRYLTHLSEVSIKGRINYEGRDCSNLARVGSYRQGRPGA